MTQFSTNILDALDDRLGSMIAPAHQSHTPQYIGAPMTATFAETQAAQGPTFTCSITDNAKRFIESRREARDAAVGRVVDVYREEAKEGKPGVWDRRAAGMAAITVTVPDRAQAEERAAMDVAVAVEDTWNSVHDELRALYPDASTKG